MSDLVEIHTVYESGFSGSWEWVIYLASNDDGSFRLLLGEHIWDGEDDEEPRSFELPSFRTGSELLEFLQKSWVAEHDQLLDEADLQEIVRGIQKFDAGLGEQVLQAIKDSDEEAESGKTGVELLMERCAEGARWKKPAPSGGGAMWYAIADYRKMSSAVSEYVNFYYSQHGVLPEGVHSVLEREVTFPPCTLDG